MTHALPADRIVSPDQIVAAGLCIGCGVCVAQDRGEAGMGWDAEGHLKPRGARFLSSRSSGFSRICPFGPGIPDEDRIASERFSSAPHLTDGVGRYRKAYVGHVAEGDFREGGSSGGMVTWVAAELLRRGLVDGVVHVVPADRNTEGRLFKYRISGSIPEVCAGSCSRYYPVELSSVLRTIRETPGRYAIVGIPCFIKAVNLLRAEEAVFRDRIIYTLGLFCGHMKSAYFADSLALQMGLAPGATAAVQYRVKRRDRPANWYRAQLTLADGTTREKDWWDLADGDWGAGFFQNSACNFCDDVMAETADIAFGDAWVEPYSSDGRGTNVVVVRDVRLENLVDEAISAGRIALQEVGADFVASTQAAGLRQRREGLSWRLAWRPPSIPINKRVPPGSASIGRRRKLIYRMRYAISVWSHRLFRLARSSGLPWIYLWWAIAALRLYQGLAYSRGVVGRFLDAVVKPGQAS